MDDQFLWGSAFMVSPVLTEATTERWVYFPWDAWYDYYSVSANNPGEDHGRLHSSVQDHKRPVSQPMMVHEHRLLTSALAGPENSSSFHLSQKSFVFLLFTLLSGV